MKNLDKYLSLINLNDYSNFMEHEKWMQVIPYISFPEDWKVQITPPFNGAVVRFKIKKDSAEVSIYLDCYDYLGSYGSPYWEVCPYFDDVFRCDMYDTEALLKAISLSIETQ